MILKLFSIKDMKVQGFANPFYASTTEEGIRTFMNIFKSTNPAHADSPMLTNPQDFHLFEIGEFDVLTGVVSGKDHISLASGASSQVS